MSSNGKNNLENIFRPKMDLSYQLFDKEQIIDKDLTQSIFNGSILRDINAKNSNFNRSDFEGMRFEGGIYNRSTFDNIDFKSSIVSKVKFIDCSFKDSFINNVNFISCSFINCSFKDSIFTESKLKNIEMSSIDFTRSTFTLNQLSNTIISESNLGNCSFYYHIMDNCTLKECKLNADSIGKIWGLSTKNIISTQLVFLGEDLKNENISNLENELLSEYSKRNWKYPLEILKINFNKTSKLKGLTNLGEIILNKYFTKGIIQKDEIIFYRMISEFLESNNQLPLLSVIRFLEKFEENRLSSKNINNQYNYLEELVNYNIFLYQKIINDFLNTINYSMIVNSNIKTKFELNFKSKPELNTELILNKLVNNSKYNLGFDSKTLDIRRGSYIETIATATVSIALFNLMLLLINGCIIQINQMKQNFKILRNDQLAGTYLKRAMNGKQIIPEEIPFVINQVKSVVGGFNFENSKDLKGFNTENIESIKILDESTNFPKT